MSETAIEQQTADEAEAAEEPTATDVPDVAADDGLELEPEELEPEVDEEVEPDLELAEPQPTANLHPGRLAPALVGPSHFDLNPAFAPR